jgi:hypothetical protein
VVKFKKGSRHFKARVVAVNELGQLVVHHSIDEAINFGEVEWITEP